MENVPSASSLPKIAVPLGIPGSSISERQMRKAPPSIHENDARPWRVLPGTNGCVPVVRHSPISGSNGLRDGLVFWASLPISFIMVLLHIDGRHDEQQLAGCYIPCRSRDAASIRPSY